MKLSKHVASHIADVRCMCCNGGGEREGKRGVEEQMGMGQNGRQSNVQKKRKKTLERSTLQFQHAAAISVEGEEGGREKEKQREGIKTDMMGGNRIP